MEKIFERATILKIRYQTQNGILMVEDLWDLPLDSKIKANLNSIAIQLNRQIKDSGEESFIGNSKVDPVLQLKFDIVKYIIDTKLSEAEAKANSLAKKQYNEKILKLIDEKEEEALKGKSPEELKQMLKE